MRTVGISALWLLLALLAAGCTEPLIRPDAERGFGGTPPVPQTAERPESAGNGPSGREAAGGGVKAFTVRATKYEFDRKEIRVNQGDTVELTLENVKGYHTLKLEGYNLEAKRNRPVTFVAAEKGVFAFRCGVMCGSGHDEMTGVLIVE